MATTVNQVLRIAGDLQALAEEERQLESALNGTASKVDRVTADLARVRTKIATKKQALKDAAAELE